MEEFVLKLALNFSFNIVVIILSILTYAFNYFVLKLKKEYRGFHYQMFLVSLLPLFNITFLTFNLTLACFYGAGYRVVKPKKRVKGKAKTVRPVKA